MSKLDPGHATVLILSDTMRDAVQVRDLLQDEFSDIALSVDVNTMAVAFDARPADVLILAFDTIEKSERHYLGLYRQSIKLHAHPHRTIVLSNKDNVAASYEACRKQLFDDYVLFWPMHYDRHRLAMSLHLALRDLQGRATVIRPAHEHAEPSALVELQRAVSVAAPVPAPKPPSEPPKAAPTVLVVDDDDFMCRLLGRMLGAAGYQILLAHSADEVRETIRVKRPDLIVMDVLMPGLSGIEIARRLKSAPSLATIPIIIVTGNSEDSIVKESLKAGAVDFVVKPVDAKTFMIKVKRALESV